MSCTQLFSFAVLKFLHRNIYRTVFYFFSSGGSFNESNHNKYTGKLFDSLSMIILLRLVFFCHSNIISFFKKGRANRKMSIQESEMSRKWAINLIRKLFMRIWILLEFYQSTSMLGNQYWGKNSGVHLHWSWKKKQTKTTIGYQFVQDFKFKDQSTKVLPCQ